MNGGLKIEKEDLATFFYSLKFQQKNTLLKVKIKTTTELKKMILQSFIIR